ncbi:thiamine phosphate synthase [Shewanella benthica]|uniref:Thiamine-phosphate synthase n=1 Tax=Shewanella benthica KT99 TaxID=314608 RepID=A9EKJ4_9GAMM|nr:thiamine phosphate synthase [Shewanella benthica]EDP99488.1 phosphomethylpyrimidine kinase/thiamin-phosphate pyrophosphorylase, putative [Shewanella benthica KT99]
MENVEPTSSALKPVVWSIAGSDSGGGAGIGADLATMNDLACHACTVITTLTAQSSVAVNLVEPVSDEMLLAQLDTLLQDLPPKAIKIGLLANQRQIDILSRWLALELDDHNKRSGTEVAVILDPVMIASCGDRLDEDDSRLDFSPFKGLITLITPNALELGELVGQSLADMSQYHLAAQDLAQLLDTNVLAKGGGKGPAWRADAAQDIFVCTRATACSEMHQGRSFLLSSPRASNNNHGTGCTLSSAIASVMASGFVLHDAIVVAKAYVCAGIKHSYRVDEGPGPLARTSWPRELSHFPTISSLDEGPSLPVGIKFKTIGERLGLYPVVSDLPLLASLLKAGAKTIQLRIKDENDPQLEDKIAHAIALGRDYQAKVFINDYWELALKHNAYGVHLGQEDLYVADLKRIAEAQLALGISSHSYFELLLASQITPSYIALGHIFPTTTKVMPSAPQGLMKLQHYVDLFKGHYPLVAIGGIDASRIETVKRTGVDDVAIVRAVTESQQPGAAYLALSSAWEQAHVSQ